MRTLLLTSLTWLFLAITSPALAQIEVVFEVDMRAEIAAGRFRPGQDQVGLRGGFAPLSWQASLPLQALGPAGSANEGKYALRVLFQRLPFGGQAIQHKFRIERANPGEGWEPGKNHAALIAEPGPGAADQRVARVFGSEPLAVPPRITGQVEHVEPIASKHVASRPVWVWLPPGYAQQLTRRYPVLYLHDGQNMFDGSSAGAEWQMDETAQRLVLAGAVQPMIIVAVPSGRERVHEYTPTPMLIEAARTGTGKDERVGGGATAYGRYLVEELKPAIDARYRSLPGREHTAVGGSSLGGLVSLWLALHRSETFGAALVVSPSLWWDDAWPERELRRLGTLPSQRPRLWLDMGALEGAEAVPAARRLRALLLERGWSESGPTGSLGYLEQADGSHDELSWAARVEPMLRFLYPVLAPR